MINTRVIEFSCHSDEYGSLVALESNRDIPFSTKRVYYIYEVDELMRRGFHSHNDLEQVMICVHGSVKILLKTPFEEEVITLNDPTQGLYVGPMVWREMFDWQQDAVLLVLASEYYDENDYIRNYEEYEIMARKHFRGSGV
ncbi:MAG: WxcM-like domain-containing protein [Ruminococcaceae bacterium]|nr:WxcM-like domain-containing protein [Oscillospiraceae bacterium]